MIGASWQGEPCSFGAEQVSRASEATVISLGRQSLLSQRARNYYYGHHPQCGSHSQLLRRFCFWQPAPLRPPRRGDSTMAASRSSPRSRARPSGRSMRNTTRHLHPKIDKRASANRTSPQAQSKDSPLETGFARKHRYVEAGLDGKGQWQGKAPAPGVPGIARAGVGA